MCEAMRCGAYPIITNIGALAEVAGEKNATVVPIEGENTSKGWKVTENFLVNFANACCLALDYYDKEPQFYQEVSKLISNHVVENYDWKKIAVQWERLVENIKGNKFKTPVYYCMTSTHNTEKYTDCAISSFFENTELNENDKFFLIDNDGNYQLKQYQDKITIIHNAQPKSFAKNMNLIMKLAFVDKANFFGLSNDVVFTENWNQNYQSNNMILVPLCNQNLTGKFETLKINPVMDMEEFDGKHRELNEFVKTIDPQKVQINNSIIGFYCFYVPHGVISKVGFLDENFENGAEDTDYRFRAFNLGIETVVNTESYLLHFCGKSIWRSGESKEKTLSREKKYRNHFEKKWGKNIADQVLAQSSIS